uniref:Uncharacterized protein n=1 Tax=Rhizophora mucronata TaxID=61149 RepID=A0A2P2QJX4_RHIMU
MLGNLHSLVSRMPFSFLFNPSFPKQHRVQNY